MKTDRKQADQLPVELRSVAETVAEGGGFWTPCTGCYDTEDGRPTMRYAHSDVFGCALGNGCHECGGIGAVWDDTDYAAMANHFAGSSEMVADSAGEAEPRPDMFWEEDEPEEGTYAHTPESFAEAFASGGMCRGDESVVKVLCATRAHSRRMLIKVSPDEEAENWLHWEWIDAAPAPSASPADQVGWQPIEAAPKDAIVLLAAEFDGPGDWRIKVGYWDNHENDWQIFGASWEPSHWMPMPPPPAMSASKADA